MRRLILLVGLGAVCVAVAISINSVAIGGAHHHTNRLTIRKIGTTLLAPEAVFTGETIVCSATHASADLPTPGRGVNNSTGLTVERLSDGGARVICYSG